MSQTLQKMKILAVDDNRTNLHILQVFLKKLGHEVLLAENGEEAIRQFTTHQPDLVLLDIMMPVMDGFEAARRIKAMTSERWTPIIFLSALNRDENLVEGLDAGADDYLTKPINFVVLEAKLRSMQRSLALQQQSFDSLRRVQTISDNVIDAIITADGEGRIVSVNRAAEAIFGRSSTEMLGINARGLFLNALPDLPESHEVSSLHEHLASVLGQEREVEALRKDGSIFPATLGISSIVLDNQQMYIGVIRDISERKQAELKLRENAEQLQAYYEQTQNEQQLAIKLIERQLHRAGLADKRLRYKVIPAANFSGDIVAAAASPEGRFYALLADATGHGLAAAISVLPVLALFYRMTKLNRSVREIILELNQQLKESMPVGRFVGATLICLDETLQTGEVWVGGTPETFLFDRWGRVVRSFASENLPLGILENKDIQADPVSFTWSPESQLVIYSDGLIEACNQAGVQFGTTGLTQAAANTSPDNRFLRIDTSLRQHLGNCVAADDISLMVINCP